MKMNRKLAVLALAMGMTFSFAACGDKKDGDTGSAGDASVSTEAKPEAAQGTTSSYGSFSEIFIPAGLKLVEGSQIDKEDQDSFSLQDEGGDYKKYYMFSVMDEEAAKSGVESTKQINKDSNPQDVSFTVGDVTWTGVTYKYGGDLDVTQAYGKIGDKCVNAMFSGFAYDSDTTKAVLGGLKRK